MLLGVSAFANDSSDGKKIKDSKFVNHLENHFKLYGFIRNYFAYDSRDSYAGTDDLYYYMPKAADWSSTGEDLNAVPSFRFAALTSRVGLDVSGYEIIGYKIGAKVETDFYCGLSGNTGTATLRLRQAYFTVDKKGRSWKVGQAWHPMAADLPDIFSLESGAPFNPFSRTPQVTLEYSFTKGFSLTGSALWQMQYTSTGPEGASANYIKYGCTPEFYLGANLKNDWGLLRVGGDILSIKPRRYDSEKTKTVSDRITTYSIYEYGQAKFSDFTIKEKVVFANDGSHMNMIGGYGVTSENEDGSWSYAATHNLSGWVTATYKPKTCRWQPQLLGGYVWNFGTAKQIVTGKTYFKNCATTMRQMYRIQPEILYNLGKLSFGLEYMLTAVEYGKSSTYMCATSGFYWVFNHRVQVMAKFTF